MDKNQVIIFVKKYDNMNKNVCQWSVKTIPCALFLS